MGSAGACRTPDACRLGYAVKIQGADGVGCRKGSNQGRSGLPTDTHLFHRPAIGFARLKTLVPVVGRGSKNVVSPPHALLACDMNQLAVAVLGKATRTGNWLIDYSDRIRTPPTLMTLSVCRTTGLWKVVVRPA